MQPTFKKKKMYKSKPAPPTNTKPSIVGEEQKLKIYLFQLRTIQNKMPNMPYCGRFCPPLSKYLTKMKDI